MFDACLRAAERALADPLASTLAARNAIGCISRFGEDHRRALADGGELRRAAQRGADRLQRQIVGDVLPALSQAFDEAARHDWQDRAVPEAVETVTPLEAAALLAAVAAWQRASGSGSEAGNLAKRVCVRMSADASARIACFKSLQNPTDGPDYRAVAIDLIALEAMIRLASRLDHRHAMEEIAHLRDHYAKVSLLSALNVIDRGADEPDMFVHFDVAAMLVSVEHVVVVVSRTLDLVEDERVHAHPHVETVSEPVVREFSAGLCRLVPNYLRMLRNTASGQGTAVPEFGFSILRVLLQINRLVRLLHLRLGDDGLAEAMSRIANEVAELRGKLLRTAQTEPDLQTRMRAALDTLAAGPVGKPMSDAGAPR